MTERPLLRRKDLGKLFDECADELSKRKSGTRLMTLGSLLAMVGETTENPICRIAHYLIGSYGAEVHTSSPFISTVRAMLPDEFRDDYASAFEVAVKEGAEALRRLKKELCEEDKPNYEEVISALAQLAKHDYILTEKRTHAERILRPAPLGPPLQ